MRQEPKLLANRIRTPDGTILQSYNRHDYKQHTDAVSGESYIVDGGTDYLKRTINKVPAQDISVYTDDPHNVIREAFCWGTYGPDGDQPLQYVAISQLTEQHIGAILRTQKHIGVHIRKLLLDELEYRMDNT